MKAKQIAPFAVLLFLTACEPIMFQQDAESLRSPLQPAETGKPSNSQPAVKSVESEKMAFLAESIGQMQRQMDVFESRLKDTEYEISQAEAKLRQENERSTEEIRAKLETIENNQEQLRAFANQVNQTLNLFNQSFTSLQKDQTQLNKFVADFSNNVTKTLAEERDATRQKIEDTVTARLKIFLDELARQAEKTASLESKVAMLNKESDDLNAAQDALEKNLTELVKKKIDAVVDELAKQEGKLRDIDARSAKTAKDVQTQVAAQIEKSSRSVESQLKEKFAVILDELVQRKSDSDRLSERLTSVEKMLKVPENVTVAGKQVDALIEKEKENLENAYQKELERRLEFYGRFKSLLEEVAAKESELAVYRAKIKLLESAIPETSLKQGLYSYYVVRKGDSLWTIAKKHNVTPEALRRLNDLKSDTILPGQMLKVPK
jgi:LysM repeat protein